MAMVVVVVVLRKLKSNGTERLLCWKEEDSHCCYFGCCEDGQYSVVSPVAVAVVVTSSCLHDFHVVVGWLVAMLFALDRKIPS
jgi:hypothetical protein